MTQRIFLTVGRGITDKTAVCVYPWEKALLEHIHSSQVDEQSIEDMCNLKGPVKVEKVKLKHTEQHAPGLREQYEAMVRVDPDEDPVNDPVAEYDRLVGKYGMDKDVPLPVVTRIYGEFNSGTFAAALKQSDRGRQTRSAPAGDKLVEQMTINELRAALTAAGIQFDQTAKKADLADLLATATA